MMEWLMNDESKRTWKKVIEGGRGVFQGNTIAFTRKYGGKPRKPTRIVVARTRFETRTAKTRGRSTNHSVVTFNITTNRSKRSSRRRCNYVLLWHSLHTHTHTHTHTEFCSPLELPSSLKSASHEHFPKECWQHNIWKVRENITILIV
jgi:hypothetical protein